MAMSSQSQAEMLLALLTTDFPDPESSARGHKTFFCISCNTGPHKLKVFEEGKQHQGHEKLQVYRTSNRPSVLEVQIGLLLDLTSIHIYSINQKKVVFLTGPNKRYSSNLVPEMNSTTLLPPTISTASCTKCIKLLNEAAATRLSSSSSSSIFCSLGCKFEEQLFKKQAEQSAAATDLAAEDTVAQPNITNTQVHSTTNLQSAEYEPSSNDTSSDHAAAATTTSNASAGLTAREFEAQIHESAEDSATHHACRAETPSNKRKVVQGGGPSGFFHKRTRMAPQRAPLC